MPATRKSAQLTLKDRLSRLTITQAWQLLGPQGKQLLVEGGKFDIDPDEDVSLTDDAFVLNHPWLGGVVSIQLDTARRDRLRVDCNACPAVACVHRGAALSFILEEKMALGLSAPPPERIPVERLTEDELVQQALAEREERAKTETMRVKWPKSKSPWTDYLVSSAASGKTYRVALRGLERGQSFCSCPDFRKNTLGTCKHILGLTEKVRKRFPAPKLRKAWRPDRFLISVGYGEILGLRLEVPVKLTPKQESLVKPFAGRLVAPDGETVLRLLDTVRKLERLESEVTIYPDAEELISLVLHRHRVSIRMAEVRGQAAVHPLRSELLNAELLPYQLDGIAFATAAGRSILADDMGLGKTIQAIGVAEMLRREAGISKVLVICPASVKAQWAGEVKRFCGLSSQIVVGSAEERAAHYGSPAFFIVCNYEQVLRDIQSIEQTPWDLIVLDEGQRIKNWEAKTTRVVKALCSPYALVLTGTPLENRLDDLYSIIEFLDDRRLGPAFRFFNRHRVVDERGKVLGYRDLALLRETLKPVLLRRTRQSVLQQLPPRTTEIVRIEPTDEQAEFDQEQMRVVSTIVSKKYLTEMDLLRLQKALLLARMSADSTFLVRKQEPSYSSKLDRLRELLADLLQEEDRKIVLFSEWTTMLDLIERDLDALGARRVRLDGSVPQKKRQQLVNEFRNDPECRLFIATNAGSVGLNLQAANTVINVDLPWNPAVLEQRIGRAHRMGQKRPVQVYILVTEGTIEEKLLGTLSAKAELAQAALDPDSDLDQVDLASGMEELKRRLEILLGAVPEAPRDESQRAVSEAQARAASERKERVAEAGGQLLSAAFAFLSEMLPATSGDESSEKTDPAAAFFRESLSQCLETNEAGKPQLTITLPDEAALENLAATLARLAARGGG